MMNYTRLGSPRYRHTARFSPYRGIMRKYHAVAPDKLKRKVSMSLVNSYRGTPCWPCIDSLVAGYGNIWHAGALIKLHRYTYELFVGPIPADLEIDHLCRYKACCNPLHLEPVTHVVNCQRVSVEPSRGRVTGDRMLAKKCCPRGHAYSPENTRITKEGKRLCRECGLIYARRADVRARENKRARDRRAALRAA